MKIKEILDVLNIKKEANRLRAAYRLKKCEPEVKKAFKEYIEKGFCPDISATVTLTDGTLTFNTRKLIEDRGMPVIKSLFIVDDLIKANRKNDAAHIAEIIDTIAAGEHRLLISAEDVEALNAEVEQNHKEVWDVYQKNLQSQEERVKNLPVSLEDEL